MKQNREVSARKRHQSKNLGAIGFKSVQLGEVGKETNTQTQNLGYDTRIELQLPPNEVQIREPLYRGLTRRQLYEKVWTLPVQKLAHSLALSNVGLAKVCQRMQVPTPPRGHWTKLKSGHPVEPLPLPDWDPEAGSNNETLVPHIKEKLVLELPPYLAGVLELESSRIGVSKESIVRLVLVQYFDRNKR